MNLEDEVSGDEVNAKQEQESVPTKSGMAEFVLNQIDDAEISKGIAEARAGDTVRVSRHDTESNLDYKWIWCLSK